MVTVITYCIGLNGIRLHCLPLRSFVSLLAVGAEKFFQGRTIPRRLDVCIWLSADAPLSPGSGGDYRHCMATSSEPWPGGKPTKKLICAFACARAVPWCVADDGLRSKPDDGGDAHERQGACMCASLCVKDASSSCSSLSSCLLEPCVV